MRKWIEIFPDSDPKVERRREYRGFNKDFSTEHDLVLVLVDGEPEIWAVDGVRGFEYLLNYLAQPQNQHGHVQVVGRYTNQKFLGVICPIGLEALEMQKGA